MLQHLHEVAVTAFEKSYKLFIESDAQRVLTEMNKLKVFLTTDLGASLVHTAGTLLGVVGGADAISAAIQSLVPTLGLAVAGFGTFAGVLGLVSLRSKLAAGDLVGLNVAMSSVMMAMAAYTALSFLDNRFAQSFKTAEADFLKGQEELIAARDRARQEQLDKDVEANEKTVRNANQVLASIRKDQFAMVDDSKEANQRLVQDTHATMNKIVEASEKQVHALRNVAEEANRAIESSSKKSVRDCRHAGGYAVSLQGDAWTRAPDARVRGCDMRASSLAFEAEQRMSKAKTPQDVEAAENIYKRAQAFAQESMAMAQRNKKHVRGVRGGEGDRGRLGQRVTGSGRVAHTQGEASP